MQTTKVDVRIDHFIDLCMIKQKDNEKLHLKKKKTAHAYF